MARTLVFPLFFLMLGIVSAVDIDCNKPNEEKRCIFACPPQKTCENRNIAFSCLQRPSEVCKDTCVCKQGYFRNAGGDCVTEDDCTKCGSQNEYYSCRRQTDQLCSSLSDGGQSGLTESTQLSDQPDSTQQSDSQCKEQCFCKPGTARDENNVCVPYDQCNKPCGSLETKDYCPTDCPADYCPKSDQTVACPRPKVCPPSKCKCRFNYRRADNGICIPTRDCPPFKCPKPFEEYNPCPPLCPNGSCGQATPSGSCPAIFGRIGIVLQCSPRCRCKSGYYWNDDKICVPYDQCPGKNNTTNSE